VELFIFTRFHARQGKERALETALHEIVIASREEAGCLRIHGFRSIRDRQVFYIHSCWKDESAFERHAGLPHTVRFIARAQPLLDHALEAERCEMMVCMPV